ncbi:MAG TPA: DUF2141 domain-containing protein [Caulobacteraceae bacterium]
MPKAGPSIALIAVATLIATAPARAAMVEVSVNGVTDARGHIRVDLCTRDTFLKPSCPYSGAAEAMTGSTTVKIAGVPPGQYAIQAFHDETDQGVVHQNFLGIPREAIGFSNDAPVHLRGPSFADAAFTVERGMQRISIRLRHLFRPTMPK